MQQKYLLSEEKRKPRSVARIIFYTIIGALSFILTYMVVCIAGFIFLVWFTINGDIKPTMKVVYNSTKPLYGILVETKLKEHSTKEKN